MRLFYKEKQMKKTKRLKLLIVLSLAICLTFTTSFAFAGTTFSRWLSKNYTVDSKFDNSVVVHGLDIYAGQGTCDFEKMKADGVDFVILRVGYRGYGKEGKMREDACFYDYYKAAREAGMLIGVYFYSQAHSTTEAIEEVDFSDEIMKKYGIYPSDLDMPFFMDFEYSPSSSGRLTSGKYSKDTLTNTALAWMEEAEILGYEPGIYANLSFLRNTIDGEMLSEAYPIWVAQYNTSCNWESSYQYWQYSSSGSVQGVGSKRCDVDLWYVNKELEVSTLTSLASASLSFKNLETYTYSAGKRYEPNVKVKFAGTTLTEGTDYKVRYLGNTQAGTAYVMVIGLGEYKDYNLISFEIKPDKKLNGITITGIEDKTYTGKAQAVSASVKDARGVTLKRGHDYTLEAIGDTTNVGTVEVKLKFAGNYSGTKTLSYDVKKAEQEITKIDERTEMVTNDEPYNLGVELLFPEGKITYESSDEDVLTVSKDGLVTPVKRGTATITVTAKGTSNFKKTVKEIEMTVSPSKEELLIEGVEATTLKLSSEIANKGIKIKWTKSPGYKMDYYEVYRSLKKSSGYGKTPLYVTSSGSKTSYTNSKDLKEGTRYYFKIRGVRVINGEKYYTKWSTKANRTWKKPTIPVEEVIEEPIKEPVKDAATVEDATKDASVEEIPEVKTEETLETVEMPLN